MAETPMVPCSPRGLERAGKALWRAVHETFDFTKEPHLLAILEQACRVRDEIDRLEAAMRDQPFVVLGSVRQVQVHPLVSEARFQRKTLAELLSRLGLPRNGNTDLAAKRREAARHAAKSRWDRGY